MEAQQDRIGQVGAEGAVISQVSREVVRVHAQFFGRGPTKAKTIWRHDVIVVILEEIFTKAEEVLVNAGRFDQVLSNRQAFQEHVEPLLRNLVEQATGRAVRAVLSQATEAGIAAEVFVLAGEEDLSVPDPLAPAA